MHIVAGMELAIDSFSINFYKEDLRARKNKKLQVTRASLVVTRSY